MFYKRCAVGALMAGVVGMGREAGAGTLFYMTSAGDSTIYALSDTGVATPFASGGGLNEPFGLAFDAAGNLYAANDGAGAGISKITPAGVVTTFATDGGQDQLVGLAFDSKGNLFAANDGAGTIMEISPAGHVSTFATGLAQPQYLAFDKNGNLLVTQEDGDPVVKVSPTGVVSNFSIQNQTLPSLLLLSPEGLAINGAGTLFVSSNTTSSVESVAADGTVGLFVKPGTLGTPLGTMAFDGAGNLYETSVSTVFKISPNGTPTVFFRDGTFEPVGLAAAPMAVPLPGAVWMGMAGLGVMALWPRGVRAVARRR